MNQTVLVVNLLVLATVLESDSFTRKVTLFRIARPILVAGVVIPLFVDNAATTGNGALMEAAGVIAGAALGLAACHFLPARWSEKKHFVVTTGGWAYAGFWAAVVTVRLFFSYQTDHTWKQGFYTWLFDQHITPEAFADTMIFLAFAMTITRTLYLAHQRHRIRTPAPRMPRALESTKP